MEYIDNPSIDSYDDTCFDYDYDLEAEKYAAEEDAMWENLENPLPHFGRVEYYFYSSYSTLQSWFEHQANAYQSPASILQYPMMVREYPVSPYSDSYDSSGIRYTLQIIMRHPQYHRTVIRVNKRSKDSRPQEVALWNGTLKGKSLYRMIMAISKLYNSARIEGELPAEILIKVNRRDTAAIADDTGTEENNQSTILSTKSADHPTAIPC